MSATTHPDEPDASDGGTRTVHDRIGCSSPAQTVKSGSFSPATGDEVLRRPVAWGFLSGLAYKGDTDPPTDPGSGEVTITAGDTEYRLLIRDTDSRRTRHRRQRRTSSRTTT
ncbi:hypothetical protein C9J85_02920 [Haloferax sp. wsp5]|nr:hypothetical protein C9J85_02920 [Haloferax sp. wsp5]